MHDFHILQMASKQPLALTNRPPAARALQTQFIMSQFVQLLRHLTLSIDAKLLLLSKQHIATI